MKKTKRRLWIIIGCLAGIIAIFERGETKQHCFVAAERVDPVAKDAFDRMLAFINERTK